MRTYVNIPNCEMTNINAPSETYHLLLLCLTNRHMKYMLVAIAHIISAIILLALSLDVVNQIMHNIRGDKRNNVFHPLLICCITDSIL